MRDDVQPGCCGGRQAPPLNSVPIGRLRVWGGEKIESCESFFALARRR